MAEFELIRALLEELGPATGAGTGPDAGIGGTIVGPGDDCSVTSVPVDCELVSSIDTLVGGVHFPAAAAAELIGFRSMCVSFSDVAAMGARPGFATIAVTLPGDDEGWLRGFARGVACAAARFGCAIVGGNLARGPLNVSVSAHGYVARGRAVCRAGADPEDVVCVGGVVGVGAAALTRDDLETPPALQALLALEVGDPRYPLRRYYAPEPDFRLAGRLAGLASAAIDVSDGLLADIWHVCESSGVGVVLDPEAIPCWGEPTAAIVAGDDYLLCFTVPELHIAELRSEFPYVTAIGTVSAEPGLRARDGTVFSAGGFDHFRGT